MDVVFLGTGAGVPGKERNVSSIAVNLLDELGATWLFDCGEATQHQILHTSIRPRRIEKIFITHLHGDHIFGLPGLLGSRSFQGGEQPLTIYGPKGIKQFVEVSLQVSQTHLKYDLFFEEVSEGTIFQDDRFIVKSLKLEHGIPSYGYRIIEKDQAGSLQVERLRAIGIPPGPIYKELKSGKKVQIEDGKIIDGKDFLGTPKKGKKLAVLGDTRMTARSVELAKDVDLLIHEATFSKDDEQTAYDYFHSTTTQAASIAVEAGAKALILTHISSRYQGDSSIKLLHEARNIFPNTFLAKDFLQYNVTK